MIHAPMWVSSSNFPSLLLCFLGLLFDLPIVLRRRRVCFPSIPFLSLSFIPSCPMKTQWSDFLFPLFGPFVRGKGGSGILHQLSIARLVGFPIHGRLDVPLCFVPDPTHHPTLVSPVLTPIPCIPFHPHSVPLLLHGEGGRARPSWTHGWPSSVRENFWVRVRVSDCECRRA